MVLSQLKDWGKTTLVEEGLGAALQGLKEKLPKDCRALNETLLLEAELRDVNLQKVRGTLSQDELDARYNQLRERLLLLLDSLTEKDLQPALAARPANQGSLLYQIPDKMQVQRETRCRVRIAYDEAVLLENIELTPDTAIKNIRVSEVMEVQLIDPAETPAFSIRTFNRQEQFVETETYTEWIFFVKPLREGQYPLLLRVSVLENIDGKDRVRDIVLEESVVIVAETTGEGAFKPAGIQVGAPAAEKPAMEEIDFSIIDVVPSKALEPPAPEAAIPEKKKPRALRTILTAGAALMPVLVIVWIAITGLPRQGDIGQPFEVKTIEQEMNLVPVPAAELSDSLVTVPERKETQSPPALPDSFAMAAYEVTNAAFCLFLNSKFSQMPQGTTWMDQGCAFEQTESGFVVKPGMEKHPVICATWSGAMAYCEWLREVTGRPFRLPTEAEWEYAARAGSPFPFAGSANIDEVAVYGGMDLQPIGSKAPNALGLYDMSGNASEWVADDQSGQNLRVLRGGAWNTPAEACQVSSRVTSLVGDMGGGLRVVE